MAGLTLWARWQVGTATVRFWVEGQEEVWKGTAEKEVSGPTEGTDAGTKWQRSLRSEPAGEGTDNTVRLPLEPTLGPTRPLTSRQCLVSSTRPSSNK